MKNINEAQEPLQRSPQLLKGCMLLKKGIEKKADKKVLKDFTQKLCNEGLQQHISTQEKLLYPYLDQIGREYKNIITRDHETIRVLAERVKVQDNGYGNFKAFANILEQHLRFENEVVYSRIRESLSESDLNRLQNSLASAPVSNLSEYPVKFWE